MRCKHENADHLMPGEFVVDWSDLGWLNPALVEQFRCLDCGAWLSLGHSNDTAPGVAVEIRAATLAANWKPLGGADTTDDEYIGWGGWPHYAPNGPGEATGFLAAQILNHDREQAGHRFTGEHLDIATHSEAE